MEKCYQDSQCNQEKWEMKNSYEGMGLSEIRAHNETTMI